VTSARARGAGQDLADADHEPPVEDDAQGAGRRRRSSAAPLRRARAGGACELIAVRIRAISVTLSMWCGPGGEGMEVDGDDVASALHHPPAARRVDPAESRRPRGRSCRRRSRPPRLALERVEDAVVEHLDVDGEVGFSRRTGMPSRRGWPRQVALDLGEVKESLNDVVPSRRTRSTARRHRGRASRSSAAKSTGTSWAREKFATPNRSPGAARLPPRHSSGRSTRSRPART